jgi:hypothetical protein
VDTSHRGIQIASGPIGSLRRIFARGYTESRGYSHLRLEPITASVDVRVYRRARWSFGPRGARGSTANGADADGSWSIGQSPTGGKIVSPASIVHVGPAARIALREPHRTHTSIERGGALRRTGPRSAFQPASGQSVVLTHERCFAREAAAN